MNKITIKINLIGKETVISQVENKDIEVLSFHEKGNFEEQFALGFDDPATVRALCTELFGLAGRLERKLAGRNLCPFCEGKGRVSKYSLSEKKTTKSCEVCHGKGFRS